jgi:hypothetical protein
MVLKKSSTLEKGEWGENLSPHTAAKGSFE